MAVVSIVVPVYFNAASLRDLVCAFDQLASRNPNDQFEFIFVDDRSGDDSWSVLQQLQREDPRIRLVRLTRNFGSNAAITCGLRCARGEVVAVIAADLQDPPELIHAMLEHWRLGHRVVLAARAGRDDPGLTSHFADLFYALFRRVALPSMPARGFDFFLIDRQPVDQLLAMHETDAYLMGQILWLGYEPLLLSYDRRARRERYGKSRWTFTRKLRHSVNALVSYSQAPVRVASLLGFVLSMGALGMMAVVGISSLVGGRAVSGWEAVIAVVLLLSGLQIALTGILGEYIVRSLDAAKRRPLYLIDELKESAFSPRESRPNPVSARPVQWVRRTLPRRVESV